MTVARLEDLTKGALVRGVVADSLVTVVDVTWHGSDTITLTYTLPDGTPAQRLRTREDEADMSIAQEGRAWAFDGDADDFRLASEAKRISLAHLFDPYVAVSTSLVEPLPHQITAVYERMLPLQPLSFLLADDPGAGKTIMTGLLIRELMVRGDLRRCLIVSPGSLVEQWQQELAEKFQLRFDLLTRDRITDSPSGNPFADADLLISRLDRLARDPELQAKLDAAPDWDLVVFDEAHKLSATLSAGEVRSTGRRKLAERIRPHTRNLVLLTATPHNGKDEEFELFLSLLDADRFEGRRRGRTGPVDASDLMRRMVKERLVRFDGTPLFPERHAYVVPYELSPAEAALYEQVTTYVRDEMDRAERLKAEGEGRKGSIVGFALTVLQRRLASSPEAIYRSLQRRRIRLERALAEAEQLRAGQQARIALPELDALSLADLDDDDEQTADELESAEETAVDAASAARSVDELRREIATLTQLEALAADVRARGDDTKWTELSTILGEDPRMRDASGARRKLVIFTEHRDTLEYLVTRIGTYLGRPDQVVAIHGGMSRDTRRAAETSFKNEPDTLVLVATDAAGEGINLQRAHLMVNYDLPWNPNRLEQRFGRIHRIGQSEMCHLWNLVAHRTREGDVYARLLDKIETERQALGGEVFDVLGELSFDGKPLRDLLIEAIREGDRPEVRARMSRVIDGAVDRQHLQSLLDERAIGAESMDTRAVQRIRDDLERAEAGRLQPHYIRAFFLDAFARLGGSVQPREQDRFEITRVPSRIRERATVLGLRQLPRAYQRITFDKAHVDTQPIAELICPGHPLLDATIDLVLADHRTLLRRGTVLVDPADAGADLRALVYLEHAVVDGRRNPDGASRVVSRRMELVDLTDRDASGAGPAPYLDLRSPDDHERALIEPVVRDASWLVAADLESRAIGHAITTLGRAHLAEVRERTTVRVERVRRQVTARLTYEINHWDAQASQLGLAEQAGKSTRLPASVARQRAQEMADRLDTRMRELDLEAKVDALPPVMVGGAVVVPQGLLDRLTGTGTADEPELFARETKRVERIAMDAVMAAERAAGHEPRDVSADKLGYDIESRGPDGRLRFIEVKGRAHGATTVTVTRGEIMKSFNVPASWLLALVAVHPDDTAEMPVYLRSPFRLKPEDAATSINYAIADLLRQGERLESAA
ncbi:MAG: DUF3883 domain-containing protein [Chloroflexi bacterium]|nr:DUF3883 domain-containing protein [Chloroflexota bacterium]